MALEISLLPGFGWSIQNKTVYGPGSVFQGFVQVNLTETQLKNSNRLRIVFHATEKTYNARSLPSVYNNQLFGTQRILWKSIDMERYPIITPNTNIVIPFIIQLPMVQFPPSCITASERDGLSYNSHYGLSVCMDSKIEDDPAIAIAHKKLIYMPLIETSMSKNSKCITTTTAATTTNSDTISDLFSSETASIRKEKMTPSISADVRLTSLDYVPGDKIPIDISIRNLPKKSIESISVQLHQVRTWKKSTANCKKTITNKKDRSLSNMIAEKNIATMSIKSSGKASSPNHVILATNTWLDVPLDSIPTFTYSPVFSITYQLKISIKRRGKIWSFNFDLTDIPIRLGTLGYGIRSPQEIRFYSTFKSIFNQEQDDSSNNILPVPRFLDFLEHEESLPLYSDYRLPAYDSAIHLHGHLIS